MIETEPFTIHVIGDTTGNIFSGDFKTRKYLSHRLKLQRDNLIRQFLGETNPQLSLQIDRAAKLADCQVSLVEYPDYWKSSEFGMDLADDNVLEAIHNHVTRVQRETVEAVRKKAGQVVEELKKDLQKEPAPV